MKRLITISHECSKTCSWCYGTGEGMSENSHCRHCRGTGIESCYGIQTDILEFEIFLFGYKLYSSSTCEYCGLDFKEVLKNIDLSQEHINLD